MEWDIKYATDEIKLKERISELEAMVKGYQSNEQRTAPLYKQIAELEAELKHWRDAFPDCSCPDNCLQHN